MGKGQRRIEIKAIRKVRFLLHGCELHRFDTARKDFPYGEDLAYAQAIDAAREHADAIAPLSSEVVLIDWIGDHGCSVTYLKDDPKSLFSSNFDGSKPVPKFL